jgi:hypothetical protein
MGWTRIHNNLQITRTIGIIIFSKWKKYLHLDQIILNLQLGRQRQQKALILFLLFKYYVFWKYADGMGVCSWNINWDPTPDFCLWNINWPEVNSNRFDFSILEINSRVKLLLGFKIRKQKFHRIVPQDCFFVSFHFLVLGLCVVFYGKIAPKPFPRFQLMIFCKKHLIYY